MFAVAVYIVLSFVVDLESQGFVLDDLISIFFA